jgi:hypothetical protein
MTSCHLTLGISYPGCISLCIVPQNNGGVLKYKNSPGSMIECILLHSSQERDQIDELSACRAYRPERRPETKLLLTIIVIYRVSSYQHPS